jgi:holo-[acyl-carrier protein] synthase
MKTFDSMRYIIGIGTDLVDIRRIEKLLQKYTYRFTEKIFTKRECHYSQNHLRPALAYAKRFAAKEAVSKALGCGIGALVSWQDIEILNTQSGKPYLILSQRIQNISGPCESFLSLSDEYPYAQAFVVLTARTNE